MCNLQNSTINKHCKYGEQLYLFFTLNDFSQESEVGVGVKVNGEYLSFLCRTCFREPFTMYSVTVAKFVTGPSETTP